MTWNKAIPERRDQLQSRLLVWFTVPLLVLVAGVLLAVAPNLYQEELAFRWAVGASLVFSIAVRALRAATTPAAAVGGLICFVLTVSTFSDDVLHSALPSLMALFLLTFAPTRAGRARKTKAGLAEPRTGRRASQVVANLAAAPLACFAADLLRLPAPVGGVMLLAALAEATADTVSSEIGQAFGGQPVLLTRFTHVTPGTDGAITLLGTAAGITGAAAVMTIGAWSLHLSLSITALGLFAAVLGLFFDSLLGATVERHGWLGNDLVNFSSTVFAVMVAAVLANALK